MCRGAERRSVLAQGSDASFRSSVTPAEARTCRTRAASLPAEIITSLGDLAETIDAIMVARWSNDPDVGPSGFRYRPLEQAIILPVVRASRRATLLFAGR